MVVALVAGALLGGVVAWLGAVAVRKGQRAGEAARSELPDGAVQVIDALESLSIVVDTSFTVVKASPTALAYGLVWGRALVHEQFIDIARRVMDAGAPVTRDIRIRRGRFGEELVDLHVRGARLGARYILLLANDHTEANRLEDVRRDFVANISHELKTPIGAIGLLAEALEVSSDDEPAVRRFAERMRTEATRLGELTQEIIELTRLQSADALVAGELVSIDSVIDRAVDYCSVAAAARGITIARSKRIRTMVWGDEAMLTKAVQNLVTNAVQYSPEKGRVGVGVSEGDGMIEIAVTDQGPGIAETDLDRVFERFYRVDEARSRNTGGSGLGLSIVKHVVQNHGGGVRAWSQPGRGSTFTIRLPIAQAAVEEESA